MSHEFQRKEKYTSSNFEYIRRNSYKTNLMKLILQIMSIVTNSFKEILNMKLLND